MAGGKPEYRLGRIVSAYLLGGVPPELMEQINTEYRKVLKERFDELQGTLAYGLSLLGPER